jgi:5-methylcytosine-specific restriction endonuclease McrA
MPLGRICPGCSTIVIGKSCPNGCRPGGKRTTTQRARNQKVWSSAAHKSQRLRIFERDDYRCVDCGHVDDSRTGKGLVADHRHGIDMVRKFDDAELATRCLICSGRKDGARGRRR